MSELALVIANKNYSSWSMRAWVLLREARIPFREIQLKFDAAAGIPGVERYSPSGQVPVLLVDGEPVWDSIAICEAVAELYPQRRIWPLEAAARRRARSICAEMHSGFRALRSAMPMNIRSSHPGKGMNDAVRADIARIVSAWQDCRTRYGAGGEMLFGAFGAADAMFAPVVMRFATYAVELPAQAQAYADSVRRLESVREWAQGARAETEFVRADEPYAQAPS